MSKGLKGVPLRREQELLQKGSSSGKSLGGVWGLFGGSTVCRCCRFATGTHFRKPWVNHGKPKRTISSEHVALVNIGKHC